MEISDNKIRELADESGFWGVDFWWYEKLPCFRKFLELVNNQTSTREMDEGRVLTCVYCGMEYPQDTPAWGSDVLTEHIKVCGKHPLRKAEATIAKLRAALVGLVGASEKDELEKMEMLIRVAPVPDADKIGMINAIRALVELVA
ncbi:MAG: hypothetical protein Q8O71_01135 [bacterium]|nr:hypothetical protein [bacterium]